MTEAQAIRELARAGLAEPMADESFDRFARLVRRQLGVPTALVTLVLDEEQVFPGALGLPEPYQSARRTPLSHSFCQHVVSTAEALVVEDARLVPWLADNRAIDDLGVVAYAGFPIFDPRGQVVGSLCAIDHRPRTWTEVELATLTDLAAACTSELRLRLAQARARRMQRAALAANRRARLLLGLSETFAAATSVRDVAESLSVVGTTIGARYAGLAVLDPSGTSMTYTTMDHLEPGIPPSFRRFRLSDARPSALAARTREPQFFRDHVAFSAAYPEIADSLGTEHAHARSFLPAVAGDRLLGLVVLEWEDEREFDVDAVKTETAMASYVAHALDRVRLLEERHEVAATLQSAMLTELPHVHRVELAATYSTATRTDQVGGDWYDAVVLDDDASVLMIGDVTGHDMHAAAQMGQLRSMLRTFAWCQDEPPATLLRLLDRANRGLALHSSGTALVARLDRTSDGFHVTWSSAGHPGPLVLRADGTVEEPDVSPDLMLGVLPGSPRHDHRLRLEHGDTMLLYTDGLVEQRGTPYAERVATLRTALGAQRGTATSAVPDALVRRLVGDLQRDDIAVLAVRARHSARHLPRPGRPAVVRRPMEHAARAIGDQRRWVDDVLESCDVDASVRRMVMLLTSELLTNAVQHSVGPVMTNVEVGHRAVRVSVQDGSTTRPRLLSPEPHEPGGRGVRLLERSAARWGVDVQENGTPEGTEDEAGEHAPPGKTVWFELDLVTKPVRKRR
ncbi:SpoIIE family protein phosphatase [Cellulosimicrobium terreum]|nr:SpoIIE family protein phosphatase [Cellulosimicrobium terreum]